MIYRVARPAVLVSTRSKIMVTTKQYQQLPTTTTSEDEPDWAEEERSPRWYKQNFKGKARLFIFTALLLAVGALIGAALTSRHYQGTSISHLEDCGGSPEEARRRGCHFDPVSFSWELEDCHDGELIKEFLRLDDWKWFTEYKGTTYETLEVARLGEANFWVSWDFHFQHCIYMWKKMHRAIIRQKSIDGHLGQYNHTLHCGAVLLEKEVLPHEVITPAEVRYPTCVPVVRHG
jgi:hypothetical protein